MVAFLAHESFGGNQGALSIGGQFATQLVAATGVAAYSAVATWAILKGVGSMTPLRVTESDEQVGLDVVLHDEAGYRY